MNKKLLTYSKPIRGIVALTIALGVLAALITIAQMTLLSGIVNDVFLLHKNLAQALAPLALLLGAISARAALLWGREVSAQRAAIRLKTSLRERIFAHLLRLGPAFSKGERTGELVAVVNEGVERLDSYLSRYLPQLVLSVVVPLLIVAVIWPVDWFSAALLLVTGPIIPLLMALVGGYTEKRIQAQWAALSHMSAHFLDVMQGLTTLKLFGRGQAEQERIARISNQFRDRTLQVLRYAFLSGAVLDFMTMMAIGVIATTLGVRLLNHGISFERAFLILLLTPEFYRPLRELGVQRHAAMEGEASARRIFALLETPLPHAPETHDIYGHDTHDTHGSDTHDTHGSDTHDTHGSDTHAPDTHKGCRYISQSAADQYVVTPLVGVRPYISQSAADQYVVTPLVGVRPYISQSAADQYVVTPLVGVMGVAPAGVGEPCGPITIDISAVSYTYPNQERPALDQVSLALPANTCTALVGRSGAGKSTLVNLLMRFMDAERGTISANGVPITALAPETWRERVALVPQRPYLFYGTVRDNIRLARETASDDEIAQAAALAGVTAFIDELPRGWETQVGEQGARLSAGQAQRVAIARAILKNAPILILDEPTSSLDPDSEALIRQAMMSLVRDRTVLVIAHRYNTIAGADRVVVLEDGRVIEAGVPDTLLQSGGAYARLLRAATEAEVCI